MSVSEKEAERAWGEKRFEYVDQELGGYTAGLDMFHILHCVVCILVLEKWRGMELWG